MTCFVRIQYDLAIIYNDFTFIIAIFRELTVFKVTTTGLVHHIYRCKMLEYMKIMTFLIY